MSEFEFRAALAAGFEPDKILVNGVLKHEWMTKISTPRIKIHLDSLAEVYGLLNCESAGEWDVGLRLHVTPSFDPDEPTYPAQFGLDEREASQAAAILRDANIRVRSVHCHLRSNVVSIQPYQTAVAELAAICSRIDVAPEYVDLGGGFPLPGEIVDGFPAPDLAKTFEEVIAQVKQEFPTAREVWLENGRYVSSGATALVVKVCDEKHRDGTRFLLCDGGRTNQALPSDWERRVLWSIPERTGPAVWTTVNGPTCMAYDRLTRDWLPADIKVGDFLVWENAGAYYLPWETRFSFGHCAIVWSSGEPNDLRLVRSAQTFSDWWAGWGIEERL